MTALNDMAAFANNAANGGYLLLAAVLALVMAAIGVVCLRRRTLASRRRKAVPDGRDIHPPTQLEAVEQILRDDAARYDTDAMERMYRHIDEGRDW